MIFVAYVLGLFLTTVVGFIEGLAGTVVAIIGFRLGGHPWEDELWRLVAKRFVGDEMTPFLAPQLNRELLQLRLDATQPRSADTKEKASQPLDEIRNLLNQQGDRLIADCHWAGWYDVLDKYFSQPPQAPGTNSYILSSSHYAAWAVMALMWIGPYSHPAAWIMCWVIVTVSLLQESLSVLGQKLESARPSRQTAIMLQHLHAEQEAERLRGIGQRGGQSIEGASPGVADGASGKES